MAISEREANALVNCYLGLRKAVFIFGALALFTGLVMAVASVYRAGWEKGRGDVVIPAGGPVTAQQEHPPAPRPVRHRRIVAPPKPVVSQTEGEETEPAPEPEAAPVSHSEPATAPAPVVVFVANAAEKHFIAHHKGRSGCDGNLILSDARLRFDCLSHPERGMDFERFAISANDDGIRDIASGRKYHFKVNGMDKQGARVLFNDWVRNGMAVELGTR